MLLVERRPLFEDQSVGRDMLRTDTDGPVKSLRPITYALTGQAKHQIQIDIAEAGLTHQPEGPFSLAGGMGATDPLEESVLNSLNPYTQPGHPTLPQCVQLRKIHRSWIGLKADLCVVLEGKGGSAVIEDVDELRCVKY